MKKPFVAVIGNRDSGKSTIIRSLTGARTSQFRGKVMDKATSRTIEVIGSSPQENLLSLSDLRKILKGAASSSACNGVVCALQPTNPRTRLSMERVLQEAIAQGFSVHAFILDPDYAGRAGQETVVTTRLSTIGVIPTRIDSQRFAHLNAAFINKRSRVAA